MKRHLLNASLLAAGMLCATSAMAQDQVVKLTTSKAQGETLTFRVNQVKKGVTVDWGDGNPVTYAADGNDLLTIEGTLKGQTVTITANKNLNTLVCEGNQLTSLDVSAAPRLRSLYCQDNELATLDVSNLSLLTDLNCSNNKLTKMVLLDTQQPELENINLANNEIKTNTTSTSSTTFYLKLNGLQHVNIAGNKFKVMNLTANRNLDVLICNNNDFDATLNLAMNDSISAVVAHNNAFMTFSLPSMRGATVLRKAILSNNNLSTLNFEKSLQLNTIMCNNNALTSVVLPPATKLDVYACENNSLSFNSLPTKKNMPTHITYAPQNPNIDITNLLQKDEKGYYFNICPDWSERLDTKYVLTMHDLLLDPDGQRTITATWKKEDESGNWVNMTKANAANKTNDVFIATSNNSYGNVSFLNAYDKVRCELTSSNYPNLTYVTTDFRIYDVNSGISQTTSQQNGLTVWGTRGQVCIQASSDADVRIVNMAGQTVWNGKVDAGSTQQVNLPSGVYVVNGKKVVL